MHLYCYWTILTAVDGRAVVLGVVGAQRRALVLLVHLVLAILQQDKQGVSIVPLIAGLGPGGRRAARPGHTATRTSRAANFSITGSASGRGRRCGRGWSSDKNCARRTAAAQHSPEPLPLRRGGGDPTVGVQLRMEVKFHCAGPDAGPRAPTRQKLVFTTKSGIPPSRCRQRAGALWQGISKW